MQAPDQRKPAIGFIFITLLIDVTGFGLIIPVLPKLIESLIPGGISDASQYGGWLLFTFAFMQFLFSPVLGNLSDQYGRRPVLLFSLFGFAIDYLFLSFANTMFLLFIGRAIAGITGASFTTASAYIADISDDSNRARNFGMVGAAFGLGFVIGPMIGGLLGEFGPRIPFMVAAGLTFLNFLYGYFILPESLSQDQRRPFNWKKIRPGVSLMDLRKYPSVGGLVLSLCFVYLAVHAVQSNWTFFTIEKFHWSEWKIGLSLGVVGVLIAAVQGGSPAWSIQNWGMQKVFIWDSLSTL